MTANHTANDTVQRFNLQTMSGVFAGTRTPLFQRVRIEQAAIGVPSTAPTNKGWLQLAWYDNPPTCVAYGIQPGAALDYEQPLLHLVEPLVGNFNQQLQAALAVHQLHLISCGSCRFWQAGDVVTPDQLPVGDCIWCDMCGQAELLPPTLAMQSTLALDCPHWQPASTVDDNPVAPTTPTVRRQLAPMAKVAESAEIRLSFWQRFYKRFIAGHFTGQQRNWTTMFQERSGVGAGTEPCFVCQARIANLGALTVETPEGDKQTFSVWRCRHCYTLYLNNWIDRWERLDNLETEESYYRIAPAEAKELLTLIYGVVGGEHPNRRRERQAERACFLNFIQARPPLSHQIRQGR